MNPLSRAFRLLIALAVAFPLGPGGLCCCVLGTGHEAAAVTVARAETPAHSCCGNLPAAPAAPAEEPASDDCDCPERDDAVLSSAASDAVLALSSTDAPFVAIFAQPAAHGESFAVVRFASDRPSPVPKLPRYRTLCVLLC